MLFGEQDYIVEFTDAAVLSFTEFSEHYQKHLLARDEDSFRKAGHKIKPVAIMLGLELIVDEYEHAKTLLQEEKSDAELKTSADKIREICNMVIRELKDVKENL